MSRRPAARDVGRAEVLERAATAIAEHGYHGTSMRDLASATGRALASFYHLFGSKDEILYELQLRAFEELLASAAVVIAAPSTSASPDERLHRFIANHVRYFVEQPAVMRVLVQEASTLPPVRRSVIRTLKQRYYAVGEKLLADVVSASGAELDRAEIERSTYCMFGMLNWIYGWYEPGIHGSPEVLAKTIHSMTLTGIRRSNS